MKNKNEEFLGRNPSEYDQAIRILFAFCLNGYKWNKSIKTFNWVPHVSFEWVPGGEEKKLMIMH